MAGVSLTTTIKIKITKFITDWVATSSEIALREKCKIWRFERLAVGWKRLTFDTVLFPFSSAQIICREWEYI